MGEVHEDTGQESSDHPYKTLCSCGAWVYSMELHTGGRASRRRPRAK